MESLREDLCKKGGNIVSAEWHKDILKEREKNLKSGTDSFLDWEDAKKQIRDKIQHGQKTDGMAASNKQSQCDFPDSCNDIQITV